MWQSSAIPWRGQRAATPMQCQTHAMTAPALRPTRLVLDTNVWLDLWVFNDPRCAHLREAMDSGRVHPLLRQDCHDEWRRVLAYPALGLDDAHREALACLQRERCEWIESAQQPRNPGTRLPRCRDPDDQKFLELAQLAGAGVVLSRDRALLDLDRRCRKAGLFAVVTPWQWPQEAVESVPHDAAIRSISAREPRSPDK